MATATADTRAGQITASAAAVRRIAALRTGEGNEALMLRVTVSGGGCSGFQYGFSLDEQVNEDDAVFEADGIGIVVDDVSLGLLDGSEVDYVEDLVGSYFAIKNPNAASTCGCGTSFAV